MALTPGRWIMAALVGCMLLTTGLVSSARPSSPVAVDPPEHQHLGRIQRRTMNAAQQLRSLTRRDSVLAVLAKLERADKSSIRVVMDPRLPPAHGLLVQRSVERMRRQLHIDSVAVPTSVVVVLDTASPRRDVPTFRRGEMAFEYSLAENSVTGRTECVAILAIQSPPLARPGAHRRLAEQLDPARGGERLLGPCAFQARFGMPGAQIDAWLRARAYELAFDPTWEEPERDVGIGGEELRDAARASTWEYLQWNLSTTARACAAGKVDRCEQAMVPQPGIRPPLPPGAVVRRTLSWDPHWGGLATEYLSALVTAMGPERFARFWRSDLAPDAALRAVAGMSLGSWTQQWIGDLSGPLRAGSGIAAREVVSVAILAALCLALTAWGFRRRQVR